MGQPVKQLTWRELRNFSNHLPEERLDDPVIWWGDERGGVINGVETLKENYYDQGEGFCGEEDCLKYGEQKTAEELLEDCDKMLQKGTPILYTDLK